MIVVENMARVKMKLGVDTCGIITAIVSLPEETKKIVEKLPDFIFRKDDIMICTYQQTGTNWLYEMITMINNRSAERVKTNKMRSMIEINHQEELYKLPSPRVLNCHLPFRYLPKDMKDSRVKTVLCFRNPKDLAVSFYNFTRNVKFFDYSGKFEDWLPVYLQGKLTYGKYTDYLKEWEKAITDGVEFPLHVLYYEDLKVNGKRELDRLLTFLEVDIDEQLRKDILDACDFEKMAQEKSFVDKEIIDRMFLPGFSFFRKGQIGDWKNWFTVAQDEMFNEVWNRELRTQRCSNSYIQTVVCQDRRKFRNDNKCVIVIVDEVKNTY